ncbi:MAG: xanthine phosphoribosyltransferase [Chloroflexi bacterium]|jgi:xanthine phosphoribosyltransferase|nr:xanthine phosphoribosyltransferase [Chloroflexota bacterium]MBT3671222.1 xanthine phosphoribosyltransferase [Chloroflexota bacterium]MBT4003542.1 xanthine phosphoribosyltransferase [Chloroflexota bacterium]MBT4304319.1 xanthine phosphoribosyltransferase [Chloroflexota bacterium]MBT4534338.1 xanthine phosphoribosyltransferase [Chloroflexota bacterium]
MDMLKQRILKEGKNLGDGILKVDGFINHQVDPVLMDACGLAFAKKFADLGATKILTAEISGIAPAVCTGIHMDLPVVYARKSKPITMPDQVFLTLAPSHTKGRMVELIVSPEYLGGGEKILIIDDFLASGATILGLVQLTKTAGSELVGIGALVEKTFEGGREALSHLDIPVEALAMVSNLDGVIQFAN